MKKTAIIVLLFLLIPSLGLRAQLKDISFTIAPVGEYSWFDNKSGVNDIL